jgi:hypothetical protein
MADTVSSTEVRTETITGALELTEIFRDANKPVYLHSAPGIGKSAIMNQLAKKHKVGFKDIRVGTMLPEDLTGIPVPDLAAKVAVWLRANFWPNAEIDGAEGIIAFDELSDASRPLQSCIYRVILDRQIGDYKLPEGWWPMAAGNRREDRAAAQSLSTALANRFAHIQIRPDVEAWALWANTANIDPYLIGFLKYRQDLLHSMEGANLLAFPTPRSWEMSSPFFQRPPEQRLRLLSCTVGEGAAMEVETFFKTLELPDFDDILKNPGRAMIPQEPGSRYALSSLLSRKLTSDNFSKILKYVERDGYGADYATVTILDAAKRDPDLCETAAFNQWARSNKSVNI